MLVTRLAEYAPKYHHVKLERDDLGILVARMHTDGQDLVWGHDPEEELASLWEDIARDPENRVVILTGSGETFIDKEGFGGMSVTPEMWHRIHFTGRRLVLSHLDIEVPMIAAINGPRRFIRRSRCCATSRSQRKRRCSPIVRTSRTAWCRAMAFR